MHERCSDQRHVAFGRYGGAGIRVCEEWSGPGGYEAFLAHVGRRPSARHSIDRIDNDRGYEPGNVRWATATQQARNKRCNRAIEIDGIRDTLAGWAERSGLSESLIRARIDRLGWEARAAVSEPASLGRNGQMKLTHAQRDEIRARRRAGEPLKKLAASFGVAESTVSRVAHSDASAS